MIPFDKCYLCRRATKEEELLRLVVNHYTRFVCTHCAHAIDVQRCDTPIVIEKQPEKEGWEHQWQQQSGA